jgi:hypothetical protein
MLTTLANQERRMKKHVLTLVLLLLASAAPAVAQKWTKSTWKNFAFSAEYPSKPKLDSTDVDGHTMVTIGAPTKTGYYAVMVTQMPEFTEEVISDSARREQVLDGAQERSISDAGSTLRSQRPLLLGGRVGREIISTLPDDGMEIFTRVYIEEGRMYMQIAVVATGKESLATKFLKSFKFL